MENLYSKMHRLNNFLSPLILIMFSPVFALAESTEASGSNSTIKSVFKEVKKDVSGSDTLTTFLMIIAVIIIVVVAVYLSFSGDSKKVPKAK
jgi:hypothetical protein